MNCEKTIARGTTPIIRVNFSTVSTSDITDAYLTVKHDQTKIFDMPLSLAVVEEGAICWKPTQQDTLKLPEGKFVTVYIDWKLSDGTRGQSKPSTYKVTPAGRDEVM